MSEETTLKLRLPTERYIALLHMARQNERSANAQVNYLISRALSEFLTEVKKTHRGQEGGSEGDGGDIDA